MSDKNAPTEANKKWQEKNNEHAKYLSDRSRTRSFIKNQALLGDLSELESLIKERHRLLLESLMEERRRLLNEE